MRGVVRGLSCFPFLSQRGVWGCRGKEGGGLPSLLRQRHSRIPTAFWRAAPAPAKNAPPRPRRGGRASSRPNCAEGVERRSRASWCALRAGLAARTAEMVQCRHERLHERLEDVRPRRPRRLVRRAHARKPPFGLGRALPGLRLADGLHGRPARVRPQWRKSVVDGRLWRPRPRLLLQGRSGGALLGAPALPPLLLRRRAARERRTPSGPRPPAHGLRRRRRRTPLPTASKTQ